MNETTRDNVIDLMNENTRFKAEIERLRSNLDACGACMKRADAEIERLREEVAALNDEVELKQAALTGTSRMMGEEIERLRQEKADILAAKEIVFAPPAIPESFVIQEIQKANVALRADISRLWSALATADEMRRADEAEIQRLRAQLAATEAGAVSFRNTAEAEFTKLRGTLREIRIRLHAAGRRPEECYEMSLIDEALGGKP